MTETQQDEYAFITNKEARDRVRDYVSRMAFKKDEKATKMERVLNILQLLQNSKDASKVTASDFKKLGLKLQGGMPFKLQKAFLGEPTSFADAVARIMEDDSLTDQEKVEKIKEARKRPTTPLEQGKKLGYNEVLRWLTEYHKANGKATLTAAVTAAAEHFETTTF